MINGKNVSDQPIKIDLRTYDNIQELSAGRRDDYTNGCLLDYNYFKKYYKMIVIDLSKQQALDSDPKAMQPTNFARNLVLLSILKVF